MSDIAPTDSPAMENATPAGGLALEPATPPQSARPKKLARRRSFAIDKNEVVKEVLEDYDQAILDRQDWSDQRLQRMAKLRGWTEAKQYPWPNSSNAHIPMIQTDCLKTQDTLHNAVLAVRPVMGAKALRPQDKAKADAVDQLLDYQIFCEQKGEEKIGEAIQSFVEDGKFVIFIPWVKDEQTVTDVRTLGLPPEHDVEQWVAQKVKEAFPDAGDIFKPKEDDPYSYRGSGVEGDEKYVIAVDIYSDESDRLIMVSERKVKVYDGPCWQVKALEDVVVPPRSANLQMPSPSNPNGAPFVVLVDYPTRDEIIRLQRSGFYDLLTDEDMEKITEQDGDDDRPSGRLVAGTDPETHKTQRDVMAGQTAQQSETIQDTYTRLMYFGRYDVDGDGLDEDVIFWVLKEPKLLMKARYLTEMYPAIPPRRPFAEAGFLPVKDQFYCIGLPELMESLHDLLKIIFDQMIDAGTLANTPFGFYRAASGLRPEVMKIEPGAMYPVSDPARDVQIQAMGNNNQSWSLNMVTLLQQYAERQTVIGELQLGRVPNGKASALRTASATQTILQQGDARPERILRRFFRGLAEAYQQTHELNQAFLPPKKQFRITGQIDPNANPYAIITDPEQIRGRFQFDFAANVLNTNKGMRAQTLQGLAGTIINGMTMQMGITSADTVYTLLRELVKSNGEDPDKLKLHAPSMAAGQSTITFEQAIGMIADGQMPSGTPAEGAVIQSQMLQQFQMDQNFYLLSDISRHLFMLYSQQVQKQAMQQQMMAQHANAFAGTPTQGGGGGGETPGPMAGMGGQNPPLSGGELMNEALPSAGGGGNPMPQ